MEKRFALISVTSQNNNMKYGVELIGSLSECQKAYQMILDDANGVVKNLANDIIMLKTTKKDRVEANIIYRITSEEDAISGWLYSPADIPDYQKWLEKRNKELTQ